MSENPYQPPKSLANSPPSAYQNATDQEPFPYFVPIVQFTLRLLGVYLFVVGASYVIQNALEFLLFDMTPELYDPRVIAALGANVLYTGVGVYFCLGGQWVIERVFLPAGFLAKPIYDDEPETSP